MAATRTGIGRRSVGGLAGAVRGGIGPATRGKPDESLIGGSDRLVALRLIVPRLVEILVVRLVEVIVVLGRHVTPSRSA